MSTHAPNFISCSCSHYMSNRVTLLWSRFKRSSRTYSLACFLAAWFEFFTFIFIIASIAVVVVAAASMSSWPIFSCGSHLLFRLFLLNVVVIFITAAIDMFRIAFFYFCFIFCFFCLLPPICCCGLFLLHACSLSTGGAAESAA